VAIPVGHEIALSLPLLAMTKGMRHCQPFLLSLRAHFTSCHSERSEESHSAQGRLRVAISGKAK